MTQANWARLRASEALEHDPTRDGPPPAAFVTDDGAAGNPACWAKLREQRSTAPDYDVVVCGGTLGVFVAHALALRGLSVAVVEAGKLRGREQEWNISRQELDELVELGVLTKDDLEEAVTTEFPGCRSGFKNREGECSDRDDARRRRQARAERRCTQRGTSAKRTCLRALLSPLPEWVYRRLPPMSVRCADVVEVMSRGSSSGPSMGWDRQ